MKLYVKLIILALVAPLCYLAATVEIQPSPDVLRAVTMPWGCQAVLLGLGALLVLIGILASLTAPTEPPCDD